MLSTRHAGPMQSTASALTATRLVQQRDCHAVVIGGGGGGGRRETVMKDDVGWEGVVVGELVEVTWSNGDDGMANGW